ncbi:MAG: helix-turn-helix domain-containing protein [Candidatus Aenigmatarchaeota archaeon]|nr:MAG: helix-turn-helix domain-containing protein [Candidatus Aenigmarchaeota archaeon]
MGLRAYNRRHAKELIRLGKLLRVKREDLGMRREVVAKQVGVSTAHIYNIETGRGHDGVPGRPSYEFLATALKFYGCSPSEKEELLKLAGYDHQRGALSGEVQDYSQSRVERHWTGLYKEHDHELRSVFEKADEVSKARILKAMKTIAREKGLRER